jgi:hypothetical protein
MKYIALILTLTLPLSACVGTWKPNSGKANSGKPLFGWLTPTQKPSALQSLGTGGQSAAVFDSASAAQRAEATAQPSSALGADAAGRPLGAVTVALGSPAETGFWLKSNLVSAPAKGRAVLENGAGVNVDLLPSTAPAQMSLSAYRTLGLGLTDLPQMQVLALP